MPSENTSKTASPARRSNDIYTATISSFTYWQGWEITWPCGASNEFYESATLYQLGEAIAEHRDNCKMGCT
jgi:hypothetical protein